jgi:hypothetical protein
MTETTTPVVIDSQNGWYQFAKHACEQHRFVDHVVAQIWQDESIDSDNHYVYVGDDLVPDIDAEDSEIDDSAENTFRSVVAYYKEEGYQTMHTTMLMREGTLEYYENDDYAPQAVRVMHQTMLDMPRLDVAFRCYRSIDRVIEEAWHQTTTHMSHSEFSAISPDEVERQKTEFESEYVARKYPVGAIVPITTFTSVGMIVGDADDSFNLDGRGVVLRITVPPNYPHYCYYENGGRAKLEQSEVILAYSTDRADSMLTHGMRVRAVHRNARIGVAGRLKTAVIDVDIEPLPTPLPLTPTALVDNFKSIDVARATQPRVAAIVERYEALAAADDCTPEELIAVPRRWQLLLGPTLKRKLESPPDPATTASPPPVSAHEVIAAKRPNLARESSPAQ